MRVPKKDKFKYSLHKLKIEWDKILDLFYISKNLCDWQKDEIKKIKLEHRLGLIDPLEASNRIKVIIGCEQYTEVVKIFEDQLNLLLLNNLRYRMNTYDPNLNQFRLTLNKYKSRTSPESFDIAEKKLDSLIKQLS